MEIMNDQEFDESGYPVTAGGERIQANTIRNEKDKYE